MVRAQSLARKSCARLRSILCLWRSGSVLAFSSVTTNFNHSISIQKQCQRINFKSAPQNESNNNKKHSNHRQSNSKKLTKVQFFQWRRCVFVLVCVCGCFVVWRALILTVGVGGEEGWNRHWESGRERKWAAGRRQWAKLLQLTVNR